MKLKKLINKKRLARAHRVRTKLRAVSSKPRLSVFRSNKHMYAQVIDDTQGKTVASASTFEIKEKKNKTEKAKEVGKMVAERAKKAGVAEAVFDRRQYKFHGRVKAVAEGAKEKGMKI